jgi:Ca2+-transporting ATPase
MLLRGGILCNDASLFEEGGKWSIKGDPTEAALVVLAAKAGLGQDETRQQFPRIGNFLSSDRKRMSTIHQMEDGKRLYEGGPKSSSIVSPKRAMGSSL